MRPQTDGNMKLPTIYIPTYGRADRQLTYAEMPPKLQTRVVFVVRQEESAAFKDLYPNNQQLITTGTAIELVREDIKVAAGNTYHWVMDDDIFAVRQRSYGPADRPLTGTETRLTRWRTVRVVWDELLTDVWQQLKEAHVVGFVSMANMPRAENLPLVINGRIMQWFCFSGDEKVKWNRLNLIEDLDACLQWLDQGLRIARFEKYCFAYADCGAPGGVQASTPRTTETNNAAVEALAAMWPQVVKVKKPRLLGPGQYVNVSDEWVLPQINWKKAYKS